MKPIAKVAVLGAGVMGAQIAAHLANAHFPVLLFDLSSTGGNPSRIAQQGIERLAKLKPAPFAEVGVEALIQPRNYEEHSEQLRDCDLIIEAIAEKQEWKEGLYERIAPFVREEAILVTNTSGLSIDALAEVVPEALRPRFCGVHFFNPPRYMTLVELIPCPGTDSGILDRLETFLVSRLGKGVIRAKNTPNFIANRVGVFALLAAVHYAERFDLPFNVVDELTGKVLGRPKSATFRTADVVGLDTFLHVLATKQERLQDDPWYDYYTAPAYLQAMVADGALGQKTGAGFYQKDGGVIKQRDRASGQYAAPETHADPAVISMVKLPDALERLRQLRESEHPQAQFVWSILRETFHYAACHLAEVAHCARDIDLALRWGFGWQEGPFETWQRAGWQTVAEWIDADRQAGKTLTNAPLPDWVDDGRDGVNLTQGSWDASTQNYRGLSTLPVYRKQLCPPQIYGETSALIGDTVHETDALRCFVLPNASTARLLIVSFKTKMHTCSHPLLQDLMMAVTRAENDYDGLVIWHPDGPFSAGADLASVAREVQSGDFSGAEAYVADFQKTSMRLRFSRIPVIAACQGLALGGGCEFLLHADRVVAALESYIGLVEVGVGLLPGGGGSKEMARRAALRDNGNLLAALKTPFLNIAMGKVSSSAENAREMGYLRPGDAVIFNPQELLYTALQHADVLVAGGYRPPIDKPFPVAGRDGTATLKMQLVNLREGHMISAYDESIASLIAAVMCGGEIDPGQAVSEDWLLEVERHAFFQLMRQPKTAQRIEHMLKTGQPLRN